MLGYAGYEASLEYAKSRPQGPADRRRRQGPGAAAGADHSSMPTSSACCSRRRATAKARSRSSCTARAWSTSSAPASTAASAEAALLLEVLTPIAKSWPSEWCLEANSLAIQVHGGYGYTRDFPVEQYWRDNRLNMIHEGTHGIQALDLLGRKVVMQEGAGLAAARPPDRGDDRRAAVRSLRWPSMPMRWPRRCGHVIEATRAAWATGDPEEALANATPYLQAFGHMVLAWIWLDVAIRAEAQIRKLPDDALARGMLAACTLLLPL